MNFVLLRDFFHAYDNFDLKSLGLEQRLVEEVIASMDQAIGGHSTELHAYHLKEIRQAALPHVTRGHFVVSMDGGTYFPRADAYIEITRACLRIDETKGRRRSVLRVPREAAARQLNTQVLRVKRRHDLEGGARPIILCDDGIGTGDTARTTIELFGELGLNIERIVVLLNPHRVSSIEGVDVETILHPHDDFIWLSERDLYWGLPRSGSSLMPPFDPEREKEKPPHHGVPYTFDKDLVVERIGFSESDAIPFRSMALGINRRFWSMLEIGHARQLTFADCVRLQFISEVLGGSQRPEDPSRDQRIVAFLEEIDTPTFDLQQWLQDEGYRLDPAR